MKHLSVFASFLLILALIYYSFDSLMPGEGTGDNVPETSFSTSRALSKLENIAKAPHFHANGEHQRVREYLIDQLEALGLEVETQTGYVSTLRQRRIAVTKDSSAVVPGDYHMVKPINILGRIKGSGDGKALMLLSHYDSAKVPSYGASDAGSGVVTILESLRAYLAAGKTPENDIIVLFTDAEELGLDGAKLFVKNHRWANETGLVLNFEARGSGGPSNMILETNQGNENLVKAFAAADPDYPVASSLMYSIYKMLPNDTDSTIFREGGDIDSFFFAFIDDHFDYHTAGDNIENLDIESLHHQGAYLLPLIHYFADADLTSLKSDVDRVYVNLPLVKFIHYPFSWVLPMALLAIAIFIFLIFFGINKEKITGRGMKRSFLALISALLISGTIGFLGWKLLLWIYPQYSDIQHGFTYNGHSYIAFFTLLSIGICFAVFRRLGKGRTVTEMLVGPIVIWLLVNVLVALFLKGAGYFIIPVFFILISFYVLIRQERPNIFLLTLLVAPAIVTFSPLIQFFPVGLGLKMVAISCVFAVLLFGLAYSVIGFFRMKRILSILCFLVAIGYFFQAHFRSDFSEERKKPNSLVYYLDGDSNESYWVTYDREMDEWTKGYLGESPEPVSDNIISAESSKYQRRYKFAVEAPMRDIPEMEILADEDTVVDGERRMAFSIIPKRDIDQLIIRADSSYSYSYLSFNGIEAEKDSVSGMAIANKYNENMLSYRVAKRDTITICYRTSEIEPFKFTLLEYSYDLLSHPEFTINKRPAHMMPKPFVNSDAVVVKKSFSTNDLVLRVQDSLSIEENLTLSPNE